MNDNYQPKYKFKIGKGVLIIYKPFNIPLIENWKINLFMLCPCFNKFIVFKDFNLIIGNYEIRYREYFDLNDKDKCLYCLCDPSDCMEDYYEEVNENERVKQCYHQQLQLRKGKEKTNE